jgi:phospholipid/cholesterol/gamma-HCH transport system ATP-binding protein
VTLDRGLQGGQHGKDDLETNQPNAIELIGVDKFFGQQHVLKNVSLPVPEGTTTVIVGSSGGGKSVILKHMLGLMQPDAGRVVVFGKDMAKVTRKELKEIRKGFGVLFQNVALFDSMNVYDNVALPLRERTNLSETDIRRNVEEKLSMMDLEGAGQKFPAQISGGMQKRVGLARALVLNPKVVFFDEPTTGLDISKSNEIYRLFYKTQQQLKYSAVIVSHDVPKIFKLSDSVALLAKGVVYGPMTPEEFQLSDDPVVREFVETTMGSIYASEWEEAGLHETV